MANKLTRNFLAFAMALAALGFATTAASSNTGCTAEERKDPKLAQECADLDEAVKMAEDVKNARESLSKAFDGLKDTMRKLEENDLKLRMQIAPGKDI